MEIESDADYTIKVILVGSSGVGKTSLVSSFFDNPFENQALPTVAPASCNAIIEVENKKKVELQIWDTAGQERFQAISQMFYRESQVAFVCFEPTPNDNYESGITNVENWIARVRAEVPECIIFIVATKGDTISNEDTTKLNNIGSELVSKHGARQFLITSAKTGNGVHALFETAAQCYSTIFQANEPVKEKNHLAPAKQKKGCC